MKIKRKETVGINWNVLKGNVSKCTTEEMEANGEQTFQIGTFDVGEEELDPEGRI